MNLLRLLGVATLLLPFMAAHAEMLTVAVAANVKYAFDDLALEFKKDTGIEVQGVFASTGKIVAQVKSGAPFDVFLSADTESPETLYYEGLAVSQPKVYASGALVLWTVKNIDLGKGMAVLSDPLVKKIAVPNPKLAPYGRAAIQALDALKLHAAIESKLVYGESIAQAAQYIESGTVDVGFTAKSVVLAPALIGKGKWVAVPEESYKPISQGVVVLKHGAHISNAQAFVDFLFAAKARSIFEKYGYILP